MTKTKPMTATQVHEQISGADLVTRRGNVYKAFRSFFYRHGFTSEKFAARVQAQFPNAVILSHDEVWKPFRGGDSVAKGSHFSVTFTLPQEAPAKVPGMPPEGWRH